MKIADRFKNFIDNNKLAKAIYTDKSNKAVFLTSLKIVVDFAQLVIQVVAFIFIPVPLVRHFGGFVLSISFDKIINSFNEIKR